MRIKFFSLIYSFVLVLGIAFPLFAQESPKSACITEPITQCSDGQDNDGDGKADRCGVDTNGDGTIDLEPDPSCIVDGAIVEVPDKPTGSPIIPCSDKCSFSDVFEMINNVITFFFTVVLIPLFVVIIMWTGFNYIKAQGNSNAKVMLRKTFSNLAIGLLIVLFAWLVVRVGLGMIVNQEDFGSVFMFFE